MELTWGETMRDKATRLIPTPFSELVEEATSELLLSPDYERIMALCDHANVKAEVNTDLIRAVRRRIDHRIPKVRYFTIILLEALVKNCGLPTHEEIADQKGLLRDLVHQALGGVGEDLEQEAKLAALQLILNCSYWFRPEVRGTHEKLKTLADLADVVRKAQPEIFIGMSPDTTVTLTFVRHAAHQVPARDASARARARQARPAQPTASHQVRSVAGAPPVVVEAIPIHPPTEEELSGMMDGVMLLVECLNGLEERRASPAGDEMVAAIAAEVRQQHRRIATLISSGAELPNMEVLLSICDSQVAVIQRLAAQFRLHGQTDAAHHLTANTGRTEVNPTETHAHPPHDQPAAHQQPAPDIDAVLHGVVAPPSDHFPPPSTAQPVVEQVAASSSAPTVAPAAQPPAPPPPSYPPASQPTAAVATAAFPASHPPAPTIDDLFGDVQAPAPEAPPASPPHPTPIVRAAADTDDHPAQAPQPPAPTAKGNTEHRNDPVTVAAGSLNGDDEFDAFLNNRLGA